MAVVADLRAMPERSRTRMARAPEQRSAWTWMPGSAGGMDLLCNGGKGIDTRHTGRQVGRSWRMRSSAGFPPFSGFHCTSTVLPAPLRYSVHHHGTHANFPEFIFRLSSLCFHGLTRLFCVAVLEQEFYPTYSYNVTETQKQTQASYEALGEIQRVAFVKANRGFLQRRHDTLSARTHFSSPQ